MVRTPLTDDQRDRGKALGQILRAARGEPAWRLPPADASRRVR
jgi:hypothetical protein